MSVTMDLPTEMALAQKEVHVRHYFRHNFFKDSFMLFVEKCKCHQELSGTSYFCMQNSFRVSEKIFEKENQGCYINRIG